MKLIRFSKAFVPAVVVSAAVIITGIAGFVVKGGFNLGVDFQAGLIQEVQFAPAAFELTYSGRGNAAVSMTRNQLDIVLSGANITNESHTFPFAQYRTLGDLLAGLSAIEGLTATAAAPETADSSLLVQSAYADPKLTPDTPHIIHYLPSGLSPVQIEDVRGALSPLGTVAVQVLGQPEDRRFMIRMEDAGAETVPAEKVVATLEEKFGENGVAVTRSDFVGSRFSKQLQSQAGLLFLLTLVLILVYASFRFKPQYAIGAVLAIAHDALVMVAFICWTRMEFNTMTIAAILTILGYSINDTIVVFDRIRETRAIYPDIPFEDALNRSLSETLGRTIITTVTTMLAVLSLFIFTQGAMKDFALALLAGMISGVYSTIFIASSFVCFWERGKAKRLVKTAEKD